MTQVLDHGYVKLVEPWGSDERIIEAARMSTSKGFLGWGKPKCVHCGGTGYHEEVGPTRGRLGCESCDGQPHVPGDEKLLAYLYNNRHSTPFEMAGMTIEVQAPIFVFREWHRHRTQSYNEMSARYVPLPDVNYMPTADRCLVVSASNKQAGKAAGAGELTHEAALLWLEDLEDVYRHAERVYQNGLLLGVPKEVARLPVPVGRYSRMMASANLRNWLAFLTLRDDKAAQWEIRSYAAIVSNIISELFPRTHQLYVEGRK